MSLQWFKRVRFPVERLLALFFLTFFHDCWEKQRRAKGRGICGRNIILGSGLVKVFVVSLSLSFSSFCSYRLVCLFNDFGAKDSLGASISTHQGYDQLLLIDQEGYRWGSQMGLMNDVCLPLSRRFRTYPRTSQLSCWWVWRYPCVFIYWTFLGRPFSTVWISEWTSEPLWCTFSSPFTSWNIHWITIFSFPSWSGTGLMWIALDGWYFICTSFLQGGLNCPSKFRGPTLSLVHTLPHKENFEATIITPMHIVVVFGA